MNIKKLITNVKKNLTEYWTALFVAVGIPVVAWLYVDWKLALSVFIVIQAVTGLFALRSK